MKRQAYILILVLLFQGCSPSGLLPDAAQPSPVNTLTAFDNPRSNSEAVAHSATSSLKTTADTGALTGVLILQTENGLKPVADIKIAIGETLSDDEGTERVVAYDPSTAPVAYTDSTGRFVFEELQSGSYGLILDIVLSSFLLYKEGTLNAILFDITAGEVTDLGRLEYSELPLPQSHR